MARDSCPCDYCDRRRRRAAFWRGFRRGLDPRDWTTSQRALAAALTAIVLVRVLLMILGLP